MAETKQFVVMFTNPQTGDHTASVVYAETEHAAVARWRPSVCSTYSEVSAMGVDEFYTACEIRRRVMSLPLT
jgi:hypothetical protein